MKWNTTLIQKAPPPPVPAKWAVPSFYWPILRKTLTAQIREEIYDWLVSCGLFPEEQKGSLKESKTMKKNVLMMRIDDKKAYEKGPIKMIL